MPLGKRGARGVWAKPYGLCPVSFIETCVGFLSHRCSNMSKIDLQDALIQSELRQSRHSPRLYLHLRHPTTENALLDGCFSHFAFLLIVIDFKFAVAKIGKNPSIFQEKMKKSFTRTAFLTLPRGRNNNRYAGGLLSDGQFDDETTSASIRCIEDEVATEVSQMTPGECQTQPKTFG